MNRRRLLIAATLLGTLIPVSALGATPASAATAAAATAADKLAVLASWTQPTAASTNAWNNARLDQAAWAAYHFDWSTDSCTASPDRPLGFDFRLPCWHHDFGYRNYHQVDTFAANKARVDDAFYADMKRVCRTYNSLVRPSCDSVAWTYYQAVTTAGTLAVVQQADLDRAEALIAK